MKMEEFKFNTVEEAIAAIKAGKMVWRQSGAMQATQIRQVIEKYLLLSVFYISSVRDHPNRECIKLFEYPVFGMSEISFVG